jgi:hypothetical protein
VTFVFEIDSDTIIFGPGTLSIDFDVEEVTPLTVFVTNTAAAQPLGGIAAPDRFCQSEAEAAGLAGRFRAWLSTSSYSPASHWGLPGGDYRFIRPDGTEIADSWEDLTDGQLAFTPSLKADGTAVAQNSPQDFEVWTGTLSIGTPAVETCEDWTSRDPAQQALVGSAIRTDLEWTRSRTVACDDIYNRRWYCFEQPPSQAPVISAIGHELITLNQCGLPDSSTFRYSVDYWDPDGDITAAATRVFVNVQLSDGSATFYESDSQFNTVTGDGFAGTVSADNCLSFGAATWAHVIVSIVDAAGHESNAPTTVINKPGGAL